MNGLRKKRKINMREFFAIDSPIGGGKITYRLVGSRLEWLQDDRLEAAVNLNADQCETAAAHISALSLERPFAARETCTAVARPYTDFVVCLENELLRLFEFGNSNHSDNPTFWERCKKLFSGIYN